MPSQSKTKDIFFIPTPNGDLASFYKGEHLIGSKTFPLVILSHGFGANTIMSEHARLFYNTATALQEAGMGGLLYDFRGHGLSDGSFQDMTPNRRIEDLSNVLEWCLEHHKGGIFLLGLSMGGAVSIHVASRYQDKIKGLVTWNAVPSFDPNAPSSHWHPKSADSNTVEGIGAAFLTDRPQKTIAEAYKSLTIPKMHIQSGQDLPFFESEFLEFYNDAPSPKDYFLIPEGDHVFVRTDLREGVIKETENWILKQT